MSTSPAAGRFASLLNANSSPWDNSPEHSKHTDRSEYGNPPARHKSNDISSNPFLRRSCESQSNGQPASNKPVTFDATTVDFPQMAQVGPKSANNRLAPTPNKNFVNVLKSNVARSKNKKGPNLTAAFPGVDMTKYVVLKNIFPQPHQPSAEEDDDDDTVETFIETVDVLTKLRKRRMDQFIETYGFDKYITSFSHYCQDNGIDEYDN